MPISPTFCLLGALLATGAAATDEGLVLHYDFGHVEGPVVRDTSGSGNHGKIVGKPSVATFRGKPVMRFDGERDHLECAHSASLHLKRAGTIEVWYRSRPAQGGLFCFAPSGSWADQRLVLAINTYHKQRQLLWALGNGHVWQHAGLDAPQDDVWCHAALTFGGELVKIFVDGLLADTGRPGGIRKELSEQAVAPDVTKVPLWIGRSLGLGKPYFSGDMGSVKAFSRALSEQEVFLHFKAEAAAYGKDMEQFGRVRIGVSQYPEYGLLAARVDFRGLWPLPSGASVEAALHRAGDPRPVKRFRADRLPGSGRVRAVFHLPALSPGVYEVRASVLAPNGQNLGPIGVTSVRWRRTPDWLRDGSIRPLNNLVFELLNATRAQGRHSFHCFREGWVFIQSKTQKHARLFVDSEAEPAIAHATGKDWTQEAMRHLAQGRHVIRIAGGELTQLVVRAIPQIVMAQFPSAPHVREFGAYDDAFMKRHMLRNVNANIGGHDYGPHHPFLADQWAPAWKRHHRKWFVHTGMPGDRQWRRDQRLITAEEAYQYWAKNRTYASRLYDGFFADEIGADNSPLNDIWAEAARRMMADPDFESKKLYVYTTSMYPFPRALAYAQTLLDCGYGVAWKRYLGERPDRESAERYLYVALDQEMQQWRRRQPGIEKGMAVVLGYFSAPPETLDLYPQANFKVFMDMEFNLLANAPAFSGLHSVVEYLSSYADEEVVRWSSKLFRHYCIEGGRSMLSTDPYELPHLRNGDFAEGASAWHLAPAEQGSITFRTIAGYGYLQGRYPGRFDIGDTVLCTKRSAQAPNIFSQTIEALVPGRLYSFRMYTADARELETGRSKKQKYAVSVRLENVDELEEKCFQHVFGNCHLRAPFKKRNACWMNFHYRVFRARATSAHLRVSDWLTDQEPGGPVGQELVYNFVQIQPYSPTP